MSAPGQNTAGWRRFLSLAGGYEAAQRLMGVPALRVSLPYPVEYALAPCPIFKDQITKEFENQR